MQRVHNSSSFISMIMSQKEKNLRNDEDNQLFDVIWCYIKYRYIFRKIFYYFIVNRLN